MKLTTLCYIEKDDCYLMLHRTGKKHSSKKDFNKDKWIGVGGHFEKDESPEDCVLREVKEETGLTLTSYTCRGVLTFLYEDVNEYTFLYTADGYEGEPGPCDEGTLEWVPKSRLTELALFEGDLIFFHLLMDKAPFFSLKLAYEKDRLKAAVLNGKPMELLDILDRDGRPTGLTRERSLAHYYGTPHRTAHVWITRPAAEGFDILLQKRSHLKDSYPDCYDISSAGHVPAGCDTLTSALRELKEELGIAAEPSDLIPVCVHTGNSRSTFYGKPFNNYEISQVYLCQKPVDTASLILQETEVQSVRWMNLEECIREVSLGNPNYCLYEDELLSLKAFLQQRA